jgi:hypothetical protein
LCTGRGGRQALRDTHLRFEREDLALRDLERPRALIVRKKPMGPRKTKTTPASAKNTQNPIIHRSIPAQSNGSIVACQ